MSKDLLIEIGTEELPPKALTKLSDSFHQFIVNSFKEQGIAFASSQAFATPRRLAVLLFDVAEQQADRCDEKLGPAVASAFDEHGKPSKAAEGFARSNNTQVDLLERIATDKGERLVYRNYIKGLNVSELVPSTVEQALAALPIPKRMRWGYSRAEFVRPVKWIALVFGDAVIDATILGVRSAGKSYGHRFHAPDAFEVTAKNYQESLRKRYVIADSAERRRLILEQVEQLANKAKGKAVIPDTLVDEVSALVEWPVALVCSFEERFLEVPQEALISTMQDNQKYFCLVDADGKLLPRFITVANLESRQESLVVLGNERVIRPRLSDAAFFYEQDKKLSLAQRRENLKSIVFQKQLGSIYDKTGRVSRLAGLIAEQIGSDKHLAEWAGLLSKSDLTTEMVLEFPDLQGLMGYYYALHDDEHPDVAIAIRDQYVPAGSKDRMPANATASAVALADRIDTLVGIFGIGQQPTGTKDPFALRRATLGILRIILHGELSLDLQTLYQFAFEQYQGLAADTVAQALSYTLERFRAIYHEQGFATEVYLAVAAKNITKPCDFDRRAQAVHLFSKMPEAPALASANKRVANILAKQKPSDSSPQVALLQDDAEKQLLYALRDKQDALKLAEMTVNYTEFLRILASLKPVIDAFFEQVMVMVDDDALRQNRLALLAQLNQQFSLVADLSLLVSNKS